MKDAGEGRGREGEKVQKYPPASLFQTNVTNGRMLSSNALKGKAVLPKLK